MHFDWLVADDCARVPSDINFPVTLCGLGSMCLRLDADEVDGGVDLRPAAAPCRHLQLDVRVVVSEPNDLGLAGAAWVAGERDLAERHFAASVELCERAGARPDLAWTHHDWAYDPGRRAAGSTEAKEHAEAARAIAEEIGMLGPDGPMPLVRKLLDG